MDDYRSHLKPWVVTAGLLFVIIGIGMLLYLVYIFGEWLLRTPTP